MILSAIAILVVAVLWGQGVFEAVTFVLEDVEQIGNEYYVTIDGKKHRLANAAAVANMEAGKTYKVTKKSGNDVVDAFAAI